MRSVTVLVIPAEGDSAETEQWYVTKLKEYYLQQECQIDVKIFEYTADLDIGRGITEQVKYYSQMLELSDFEIHAQGGLGAYVACRMMQTFRPGCIRRIFFVGGGPSPAMTWIAKFFHRYFVYLWYLLPIPFFADDPNPHHDPIIAQIRQSSTSTMRANPKLYRNQLAFIGNWAKGASVSEFRQSLGGSYVLSNCPCYIVPNGKTKYLKWWNNTYSEKKLKQYWKKCGVIQTKQPQNYFSFYSMMPAEELFQVMDQTRRL